MAPDQTSIRSRRLSRSFSSALATPLTRGTNEDTDHDASVAAIADVQRRGGRLHCDTCTCGTSRKADNDGSAQQQQRQNQPPWNGNIPTTATTTATIAAEAEASLRWRDNHSTLGNDCDNNNNNNSDDDCDRYAPCGALHAEWETSPLPSPLPEATYSVRRRLLRRTNDIQHTDSKINFPPATTNDVKDPGGVVLVPVHSRVGKRRLVESLVQQTAASYTALTFHAVNQSEPAYCGVTCAVVVLNALECDLPLRWKGGWRYWAHEDVLLALCPCLDRERILRTGITVDQFQRLLTCQGLDCTLKRPAVPEHAPDVKIVERQAAVDINDDDIHNNNNNVRHIHKRSIPSNRGNDNKKLDNCTLSEFRNDVRDLLTETRTDDDDESADRRCERLLVVSFSRPHLGQTGEGHFAAVAAYHAPTDSVLLLDVARYKYPPVWVAIPALYAALQPVDLVTGQARGWFRIIVHHRTTTATNHGLGEHRRPAHLVPLYTDLNPCPLHAVKVHYCPNTSNHN